MTSSAPGEASDYNTKIIEEFRANEGHVGGWFSYLKVDSPASALNYDLAADVSGAGRPSLTAAGLPFDPVVLPLLHRRAIHGGGSA